MPLLDIPPRVEINVTAGRAGARPGYFRRNKSGSLAKFAAIRRASSRERCFVTGLLDHRGLPMSGSPGLSGVLFCMEGARS
jgi:hypothetical protein